MSLYRYDGWVKAANGPAVAGAAVFVCTQPANIAQAVDPVTGVPVSTCTPTPLASIYFDVNGLLPATQPLVTDGLGHYFFYAAAARYSIVIMNGGRVQQSYVDQVPMGAAV
jgi:hypothetical protein